MAAGVLENKEKKISFFKKMVLIPCNVKKNRVAYDLLEDALHFCLPATRQDALRTSKKNP